MSAKRYTEEFKREAVQQITERNYPVSEVAQRLGVTTASLYEWRKRYGPHEAHYTKRTDQQGEIRRLQAELRRVTEERDILKKAAAYFATASG